MPLLHLPVQSGSSKILKRMNRKHSVKEYIRLIEKLKAKNQSIRFSSDFIIAYPGETKDDFEKTLSLLKKVEFINSFSFIYSSRPGTPAAKFNKIDNAVAKERLIIFQKNANLIKKNYRNNLVDTVSKVLFENKVNNENKFFGRDEYFNSVIVKSNDDLTGEIKNVIIKECNQNTLFGEISANNQKKDYAA